MRARPYAVLALAILCAAPAFAADPGVTAEAVILGSHQPLSGPAASYSPLPRASEAYFRMINELGGVHGRKIVYRYEDDSYSPPRTVEVVRKLIERDHVFAIFNGLGTPTHTAVYRYLLERGVPDLYVATGATKWAFPPENGFKPYATLFGYQPTYLTEGSILGKFAVDRWPGKKAAVFYQNDDFGKDGAHAFKQTIRGKLDVVADDVYEVTAVSIDSQVLKARQQGADVVFIFAIPKFAGMYLKKSHELRWKPEFLLFSAAGIAATWKLAGPDCDPLAGKTQCGASDGAYSLKAAPTIEETDNAKVKRHHEIMERYAPGLRVDDITLAGQAVAELMVETLRRAGRELSRESLVKGAESIHDWNEGLAPNVTMGPDDHAPLEDMQVVQIKDGRRARELTGWIRGSRPGE